MALKPFTQTPSFGLHRLSIFAAVLILIFAGLAAAYYISFPEKTKQQEQEKNNVVLVETQNITLGNYPVKIEVMGQVRAAREAALQAQISGEVIEVSPEFIPGGSFKKGDVILKIDPSEYDLDVQMKQAALNQSRAALTIEKGQQSIAKEELKILQNTTGRKLNGTDLALRKPQMEQANADIAAAQASLDMAKLNLSRTTLTAPFNALVTARNTNVGNVISLQETLATLVSTDEYWINIEVPVNDMHWLDAQNTKAVISLNNDRAARDGSLLKIVGTINSQSRLADIIVRVPDPLGLTQENESTSPLIIGDFVPVTLIGKSLINAVRLPQSYIRDGQTLWIMRDGKLVTQPVSIDYTDRTYAYISSGLNEGDQIITSNIITPVNGMDIKVHNDDEATDTADKGKNP